MPLPDRRLGQKQNAVGVTVPASMAGINAVTSLAMQNPTECVYTYNLVSQDLGMVVRQGFVEWANGWTGGPAKTVIPFEGHQDSHDRLFVANNEGIWDCTAEGTTAPTQVVTWPDQLGEAGYCSYAAFSNDGNDMFILLCDKRNGYYVYTQTTDVWVKVAQGVGAGELDGIDPTNLDYVFIWKRRVWFVEKNSANGWYLDVATLFGTVTKFNFGSQFRQGGALRAFYNWSLDGGLGLDDLMVAVSGAGDVAIYQGTDPDVAESFSLVGTWFVGAVPAGNRFGVEFGGEVYILSVYGLLPLSQLLNGSSINDPNTYLTAKISPFVREVMAEQRQELGWQVVVHSEGAQLYIDTPQDPLRGNVAFVQYFGNQAWSMVRGLDKTHTANWRGSDYWAHGGRNSLVIERGHVDNVWLDPATDGAPAPIEWSLLTSYQNFESGTRFKRCQYIRPQFLAQDLPAYSVLARYDFDITEAYVSPLSTQGVSARWNVGLWDSEVWGGNLERIDQPRGARGMGRHVAIAMRGSSSARTILVAFDVIADGGGLM